VFNDRGQVAAGKSAAAIKLLFDVRGFYGQNIAVPLPVENPMNVWGA
jgi:hypothetical protein